MKQNHKLRQKLAIAASELIQMNEWTAQEAAKSLETSKARVNQVLRNDVTYLSLDALVNMIQQMGGKVSFNIDPMRKR